MDQSTPFYDRGTSWLSGCFAIPRVSSQRGSHGICSRSSWRPKGSRTSQAKSSAARHESLRSSSRLDFPPVRFRSLNFWRFASIVNQLWLITLAPLHHRAFFNGLFLESQFSDRYHIPINNRGRCTRIRESREGTPASDCRHLNCRFQSQIGREPERRSFSTSRKKGSNMIVRSHTANPNSDERWDGPSPFSGSAQLFIAGIWPQIHEYLCQIPNRPSPFRSKFIAAFPAASESI